MRSRTNAATAATSTTTRRTIPMRTRQVFLELLSPALARAERERAPRVYVPQPRRTPRRESAIPPTLAPRFR
jgi:hypothetical protein